MKRWISFILIVVIIAGSISGCSLTANTDVEKMSDTSVEDISSGDIFSSLDESQNEAMPLEPEMDTSSEETEEAETNTEIESSTSDYPTKKPGSDVTTDEVAEMDTTTHETPEEITTVEWETDETITGETNDAGIIDGQPISTEIVEQSTTAVNKDEIVSNMPYLIKVNRQANCVTVYTKDANGKYTVPVKSMICSCARSGYTTPIGTFQISDHYVWRELFGHVYGYYSTRIVGSILFHSVPYISPDPSTLKMGEFDKLGQNASQGCIRLQVKDSKWIYDNCAAGTYVIIYDSPDPGPLGRPEAMKVSAVKGKLYGWDPTDVTPGNPWLSCTTTITVESTSVSLKVGDKVDINKYVSAVDLYGNKADVTVNGKVDTKKAGKYVVEYSVTDLFGMTDKVTVTFNVKEKETETTTKETETTTKPSETTTKPPETTTKETETTTKPPETTTKPPETTTKPPETTTKPPETTTKPPETTAEPSETTTEPPETTTEPQETTVSETETEDSSEEESLLQESDSE